MRKRKQSRQYSPRYRISKRTTRLWQFLNLAGLAVVWGMTILHVMNAWSKPGAETPGYAPLICGIICWGLSTIVLRYANAFPGKQEMDSKSSQVSHS